MSQSAQNCTGGSGDSIQVFGGSRCSLQCIIKYLYQAYQVTDMVLTRCATDHANQGILYILVRRRKTRGILETIVCRIPMFEWPFGPVST